MAEYIQVIKVARKDIPDVIAFLKTFVDEVDDGAVFNILNNRVDSPYFLYLYARIDNQPAGLLECQFRKEMLLTGVQEYGFIPLVYVKPEMRRKGVASKLFQIASIWLKNAGAKTLMVLSGPKEEGLNQFLQANGFVPQQAKFVKEL